MALFPLLFYVDHQLSIETMMSLGIAMHAHAHKTKGAINTFLEMLELDTQDHLVIIYIRVVLSKHQFLVSHLLTAMTNFVA